MWKDWKTELGTYIPNVSNCSMYNTFIPTYVKFSKISIPNKWKIVKTLKKNHTITTRIYYRLFYIILIKREF